MTYMIQLTRKFALPAIVSILVIAVVASLAASAFAASSKSTQFSVNTKVNAGVLAHGRTITTHVKVTNPEPQVKDWWSQASISKVIRQGVNGKYQMPYQSNGFRCTPVVQAAATNFTCSLIGADVPTIVKLAFAADYKS